MPRRPRVEIPGGFYHVTNRAREGRGLFDSPAAADAFVACLFEACVRLGWRLHAYALTRMEYHLALETCRENLTTGVHWLQSTFGNRFMRRQRTRERIFYGRFRSAHVEPGVHLAELADEIHLAPVNAGLVTIEQLAHFRWSSHRFFSRVAADRPPYVVCRDWFATRGWADDAEGAIRCQDHLRRVSERIANVPRVGSRRSRARWIRGGEKFAAVMHAQVQRLKAAPLAVPNATSERQQSDWEERLNEALMALGFSRQLASSHPKAAAWKIAAAAWVRARSDVTNRWLGEQLVMGGPDAVSRYIHECHRGVRTEAAGLLAALPDQ